MITVKRLFRIFPALVFCMAFCFAVAHIYTAGFGELDKAGRAMERDLLARAAAGGLRIIGPNTIGTYAPASGLSPTAGAQPEPEIHLRPNRAAKYEVVAAALASARRAGLNNIETMVTDGEDLDVVEASFDAAICRLGLMLFPDPLRGLRQMFGALKPGGTACVMVFSEPARNPCVAILASTALKHAGLPARDPFEPGGLFSLGKPGLIDDLFNAAGFSRVATTKVAAPFHAPSVQDYLAFARTSAGPIQQILSQLDDVARAAAWVEIADKLSAFSTAGAWQGPNELLLTAGRR